MPEGFENQKYKGDIFQHNGGEFQCIGDTSYFDSLGNLKMIVPQEHCGLFERVSDGWRLFAHGVLQYEDGTVEWNYSTNGHYAN